MNAKFLAAFFRHQTASMVATAVDFAAMILLVELVDVRPDAATMIGASIGAGVNFMIGRRWAFRASAQPIGCQAARYVFVSGIRALLNTVGEHALVHAWGQPYLSSRIVVSLPSSARQCCSRCICTASTTRPCAASARRFW